MAVKTKRGEKVLKAIRPNAGIEAAYQRALDGLARELHTSLVYWLRAAYRQNEPEMAQDRSPAKELEAAMAKLAQRWQRRFDRDAPVLAKKFAAASMGHYDAAMKRRLREAGLTVNFTLTRPANDALQAVVAENVGLIKSIASEHLTDVQGILMRSVARGRDLGGMTQELEKRYGITRRRAALIATDQNNKATAIIERVRQTELGIVEAIWLHSHGGKHPRPSHVAADGKRYLVAEGMLIDGERIFPGEKIRCRCVARSIIPGL